MNNQPENIAANSLDSLLGFNGERIDLVLGSYHLGNGYRLYNPGLHRFTSPDSMSPFGKGGINPYAYCEGDPINHTDPTGHFHFVRTARRIFGLSEDVVEDIATDGALAPEQAALHHGEHLGVRDAEGVAGNMVELGEGNESGSRHRRQGGGTWNHLRPEREAVNFPVGMERDELLPTYDEAVASSPPPYPDVGHLAGASEFDLRTRTFPLGALDTDTGVPDGWGEKYGSSVFLSRNNERGRVVFLNRGDVPTDFSIINSTESGYEAVPTYSHTYKKIFRHANHIMDLREDDQLGVLQRTFRRVARLVNR